LRLLNVGGRAERAGGKAIPRW